MDYELGLFLVGLAMLVGALLALAGMGFFRRRAQAERASEVQEALAQAAAMPEGAPRGRPGAGPAGGWFLPGATRLGRLRFERAEEVAGAVARDLKDHGRLLLEVSGKEKALKRLRKLSWPAGESGFLARPPDAFLLITDRTLPDFDPRYDRYAIVPLGFMEAAGGIEAFLGALSFEIMGNHREPMDATEALLRDAAEAAVTAGFAPPDVLKVLVDTFRREVFTGRYRPWIAHPNQPPGPEGPMHAGPGEGPGPVPEGLGPAPAAPPPLARPAPAARPPGSGDRDD